MARPSPLPLVSAASSRVGASHIRYSLQDKRADRKSVFMKIKMSNSELLTGWDEGVPQMSLGEKAILDITP